MSLTIVCKKNLCLDFVYLLHLNSDFKIWDVNSHDSEIANWWVDRWSKSNGQNCLWSSKCPQWIRGLRDLRMYVERSEVKWGFIIAQRHESRWDDIHSSRICAWASFVDFMCLTRYSTNETSLFYLL
jgi:hypothetical protein